MKASGFNKSQQLSTSGSQQVQHQSVTNRNFNRFQCGLESGSEPDNKQLPPHHRPLTRKDVIVAVVLFPAYVRGASLFLSAWDQVPGHLLAAVSSAHGRRVPGLSRSAQRQVAARDFSEAKCHLGASLNRTSLRRHGSVYLCRRGSAASLRLDSSDLYLSAQS